MPLIDQLIAIKRVNLIGIGLGILGLSIITTPLSAALSITNFIHETYGIHPAIMGGAMSIGGWLILFRNLRLPFYILCSLPWGFYALGSVFFVWHYHLSATVALAYLFVYAGVFREALERPL